MYIRHCGQRPLQIYWLGLEAIFARHSVPWVLISDNCPLFTSKIFPPDFDFQCSTNSSYYSQNIAEAQCSLQTLKRVLQKISRAIHNTPGTNVCFLTVSSRITNRKMTKNISVCVAQIDAPNPTRRYTKGAQEKRNVYRHQTSTSLPEPGAVAHDGHNSAWILQWFGVWQRAIFSQWWSKEMTL